MIGISEKVFLGRSCLHWALRHEDSLLDKKGNSMCKSPGVTGKEEGQ